MTSPEYQAPTWVNEDDPDFLEGVSPDLGAGYLNQLSGAVEDHGQRLGAITPVVTNLQNTAITQDAGDNRYILQANANAFAQADATTTALAGKAATSANLSDLGSAATARTNLGLAALAATGKIADATDVVATGAAVGGLLVPTGISGGVPTAHGYRAPLPFLNVKDFGAVGDGTTDDTTAIQAALTAVPAVGAVVSFPAGRYLVPNGGLTCAAPVHLMGVGSGTYESGGSRILCSSATAPLLTLSAPGWRMTDLMLENTAGTRPTAGAGLLATDADFSRVTRCMVIGFWNNLQYDSGYYYTITDSTIVNPRNYGMWLRNTTAGQFDHSDQSIMGCTILKYGDTTAGGTALRWESGGGLRFVNNKINGGTQPGYTSTAKFAYGVDVVVADGGSTSVLTITGNSLENCTGAAVHVSTAGPLNNGSFGKIAISGNEIAINGTGISIDPPVAGPIYGVAISGNVFTDCSTSIFLRRVLGVSVGHNLHRAVTGSPVTTEIGCTDVYVAEQTVQGDNLVVFSDNTVDATGHGPFGQASRTFHREIPATTSTTTYSNLWNLTIPQNTGMMLELVLTGNVAGVGTIMRRYRRFVSRGTGAATVTTAGTDDTSGAAFDLEFDTATTSGNVLVRLRLNSTAGGTDIVGRAKLVIEGAVFRVRKGL